MKSISRFLLCLVAPHSIHTLDAGPNRWDGWRGPGRDAVVSDFQVPEKWPEELERLWRVEVGGGYSSPLVEGGRVFQQARVADEEVLWCLDLATGEVIWRAGTKIAFRPGRGGDRHGAGPKSTPTMADGRVFMVSMTGVLTAWNAENGELLWKRDFLDRLDTAHPYWGASTSPLVENGRLYVHLGSCEKGALFCLDPETGKDIWVQDEHANCYSSPLVEEIEGKRQLIEFNHHGLCGVDLETGDILWEWVFPHEGNRQNTPTPVNFEGLFVLGGEDRGMFAIRAGRNETGWSAKEIWKHREVSLDMNSPVLSDGVVYGFSQFKSGQLFGLDPESGEVLWRGEPRAGENAALLAVPGHVLALTDRGELHILRSSREKCDILRTYTVGRRGGTWTAPSLIEDSLLVKDGDHLVRFRIPNGEE